MEQLIPKLFCNEK